MLTVRTDVLLAHQGGWDEAAILLGPVIVYLVIRYMGRHDPPTTDGDDAAPTDPDGEPTVAEARPDDPIQDD